MATLKSYTDLEQSKKLSEFLPLESADMKWYFWKEEIDAPKTPTFGYSKDAAESYKDTEAVYLPCWSLTALLNVIPGGRIDKKPGSNKWEASSWDEESFDSILSERFDNPIDACYTLILELHELKLL